MLKVQNSIQSKLARFIGKAEIGIGIIQLSVGAYYMIATSILMSRGIFEIQNVSVFDSYLKVSYYYLLYG